MTDLVEPCRFVWLDLQAGADLAQNCRLLTLAVLRNQDQEGSAYNLVSRISVEPFGVSVPTRDFHAKVMPRTASLDEAMIAARRRSKSCARLRSVMSTMMAGHLLETAIFSQKAGLHLKCLDTLGHRFKEPVCLGNVSGNRDIPHLHR